MRREALAATIGLALVVSASSPNLVQAQTRSSIATYDSPALALKGYLSLMNSGDWARAYRMYADIHQHMSLQSWRNLGDPFKGTGAVLSQAHVVQEDGLASVYSVINERHPMPHTKKQEIYLFSLIKQDGTWKMVYNTASFGNRKSKVFQQLDQKQQQYALQQLKK